MVKNGSLINQMLGRIFVMVEVGVGGDTMEFYDANGGGFRFFHKQGCCERVEIVELIGDLSDLVGEPILMAYGWSNALDEDDRYSSNSCTWTFYRFGTIKGAVAVRWLGSSNSNYSEKVDIERFPWGGYYSP